MIEINSKIIDAGVLFQRVENTAKSRQIAEEFYVWEDDDLNQCSYYAVHNMMQHVYENLQVMNTTWPLCEKPLRSNHRVVGGAIVFCKRIVRKLTRWLFQPLYLQQTEFNSAVTKTVSEMLKVQEMLITLGEKGCKEE